MKNISITLVATLVFGAVVSPSRADGIYVAADIGQTTMKDACGTFNLGGCNNSAALRRIAFGYQLSPMRVTPRWGAEISYGDYGKARVGTFSFPPYVYAYDLQLSGIQVSGIGDFPLSEALSLIGKIGIARTDVKLSMTGGGFGQNYATSTTNLAMGFGAQYDFSKSVSVRAQYEDLGYVGDMNKTFITTRITLFSIGIVFKLDSAISPEIQSRTN